MGESIRSSSKPNDLYRGAREALQRWVLAVQDLDPQSASDLYAEEGMAFWGTFGDHCRTNRAQVREYFERFLDVSSLECRIADTYWREIGTQLAIVTGWYLFRFMPPGEGTATETKARFTFAFQRLPGDIWKIVEHHSSLFPANGF